MRGVIRPLPLAFWWSTGGLSGLFFLSLALLAASHQPLPGDITVFNWVRTWQSPVLTSGMRAITRLGEVEVLLPLILLVALILWRSWRRFAIAQCGLVAGAPLFEWVIKYWVGRPRPEGTGLGFPSGHVVAAAVAYGLVAYLFWTGTSRPATRWTALVIVFVIVGAVAVSRVYLQKHWPSDAVGGVVGGVAYLIPGLAWLDRTRPGGSSPDSKE